jgi:hypothetical protein
MQRSRMPTELRNLVRATRLARANRMTLNEFYSRPPSGSIGLQSRADVGS